MTEILLLRALYNPPPHPTPSFSSLLFCCRQIEPINGGLSGFHERSQVLIYKITILSFHNFMLQHYQILSRAAILFLRLCKLMKDILHCFLLQHTHRPTGGQEEQSSCRISVFDWTITSADYLFLQIIWLDSHDTTCNPIPQKYIFSYILNKFGNIQTIDFKMCPFIFQ